MSIALQATDVVKKFGDFTALNSVSVAVPEGSVFGLLGPNGAGKTTLIRIVNQITMPDTGSVQLGGEPLAPKHIANIGYMPEERGLYKSMKVGEQVLYLAQLKGMSKSDAQKQAKYWFDKLDIGQWWNKKIQELSKGQAQKIQFVTTVIHQPKLLIFDEPFSGFDPINASLIKDEILGLRDQGATVIFSTHRMESVEEMCDHIALIHKSNKVLDGEINTIKRTYKNHMFDVGLTVSGDADAFAKAHQELQNTFATKPATFKTLENDLKLQITLGEEATANELLARLTTYGQVTHFVEVVPSVNDIFIQTVHNNE